MSNLSTEPTLLVGEASLIIKKYKMLIYKLIPFQQENKLLEGLNKFSGKLPSWGINIIKEEVIRLTSPTDASADNSEFAKFPMLKFKHFGISMKLDKVGKQILLRETERFDGRYTVGVYELVMSSTHYQSHVKKEQQQKITKAFKVESQSYNDIDFAENLAIRPNFTVSCSEFEKGKNCTVISLSHTGMVIATKRAPIVESKPEETPLVLAFTFPKVALLNDKRTEVKFELLESKFNKDTSVFETKLNFAVDTSETLIERCNEYIRSNVNQFPLQRDLEIERVLQNLERDRILANSPWIPVFLGEVNGKLCPLYELSTPTNTEYNSNFNVIENLPSKQIFQNLIKELLLYTETFLLTGKVTAKNSDATVAATHRQLTKTGLVKQFIELATQSKQLKVVQFRLHGIDQEHKKVALDIHDLVNSEYTDLNSITHVLYCKDVTELMGTLKVHEPEPFRPFPRAIVDDQNRWPIKVVMESDGDRRVESRYRMNTPAKVSTGLFNQFSATLNDLSCNGLNLTLDHPSKVKIEDSVKITIKGIKLRSQKYDVVNYDKVTGILRLKLASSVVQNEVQKLQRLFHRNTKYFKPRDLSAKQRNIYRFLWELSVRNQPCASVLITDRKTTVDRLKTVYHKEDCSDLSPFAAVDNEVHMHGFFADKNATGPKSQLLDSMLRKNQRDAHVIHVVRTKDQRIVFVNESDFLFGKVRNQISEHASQKSVELCVSHLSAIPCNIPNTPLTEKRLAQIWKIDVEIYEKLKSMQKGYTHVMYLASVSILHRVLLDFGIYPEAETPEDKVI